MTTKTLSVAVIGAGMAGTTHANAWRQVGTVFDLGLPQVRLHTIADAYLPFAEDAAERYGYERAVTDWRDVADDPSIDIVSIVVGNALHREIAEAMIRAGKHVLCEKPLADTLENARAMADLRRVFAGEREPSAYLYILRGKIRLAQYEKEAAATDFKKALDLGADRAEVEGLIKMTY